MRVAVAGATGCIGSRLVPRLLAAGHAVTALVRDPSAPRAASLVSAPDVRVVEGDLLAPEGVAGCCRGADVGVYLVHSLGTGPGYEDRDRRAAAAFARAASAAGVDRLVYLGGLGDVDGDDAGHLHSRRAVESVLGADRHDHRLTTVRAGVVVGPDSLSFRLMRQCAARLPVALVPPAIETPCQPVAAADVVRCLAAVVDDGAADVVEIGAPRARPYADLLSAVADALGTRFAARVVPGMPLSVAALGLAAVTDVPYRTVAPLVESLSTPAVVSDPRPAAALGVDPTSFETAVDEALTPTGSRVSPRAEQ
jgi:Nucleoside-diphosphate-sugar epimerases